MILAQALRSIKNIEPRIYAIIVKDVCLCQLQIVLAASSRTRSARVLASESGGRDQFFNLNAILTFFLQNKVVEIWGEIENWGGGYDYEG